MRTCRGLCAPVPAFVLLAFAGCSVGGTNPTLDQVKSHAERYRDVNAAIADGYTTDNKCMTAEMLGFPSDQGAMGLHYVRRDLLGLADQPNSSGRVTGTGTHTDFAKPAMLVYEPQADGSLELVAVENLVFKRAWEAAGHRQPPAFSGEAYLLLEDDPSTPLDEAHNYEPHYELHLWIFRDNPLGTFKPFNPNVTCQHHKAPAAQAAESSPVPRITVEKARSLARSGAVLVDVREPHELRELGTLENSVNLPMSSLAGRARDLPGDRPIILYCRSGRRSAIAGEILRSMGFSQVYNLGGYGDAARAGWPTISP